MKRSKQQPGPDQVVYQIQVRGRLDERWADWFNGTIIELEAPGDGPPLTTLTVVVADQARLRGILSQIWDLNLTVISVVPVKAEEGEPHPRPRTQPGGEAWEDC
jgi:hypothetical protein